MSTDTRPRTPWRPARKRPSRSTGPSDRRPARHQAGTAQPQPRPARRPPAGPPRPGLIARARDALRPFGRTTPNFVLLAATIAVLVVLGLVMTFSASFVRSTAETGNPFGIFRRQLMWCALGLGPMVLAARLDYRIWRRVAGLMMFIGLVAATLVVIPQIGIEANGARRWLGVGPVTFQPTELLKLAVPLFLAHVLARRWQRLRAGDLHGLLMPAVPLLVLVAGLVMLEPDLETAALIVAIGGLVLYTAGLPARFIAWGSLGLGAFGLLFISTIEFRRGRIEAWLDPMSDPMVGGYQTIQGYLALGSGGWFGTGLGQGRGQWLYLPNADTDFIFAIIGEELGLVGGMMVLLLFAAFAIAGVRTARAAPDPFGRLLAIAITGWLLMQAAINIGSVVGLLPVTGVPLPLLSVGGSALVSTMLALGILLSIARGGRTGGDSGEPALEAPEESASRAEGGR